MTRYTQVQILKAIKAADSAFNEKNYPKAILRYKKAAAMDNKQPIIWLRLGICYYYMADMPNAIKAYETALKFEKAYEIALNKGIAELSYKDFDNAEASFKLAISYDKGSKSSEAKGQAYFQLGRVALAKGDLKKAAKMLEKAESCDNSPKLLISFFKGDIFVRQKQYEEAIDAYKHCLELDPFFKDGLIQLTVLFVELGKKDEAIKILTTYLKKNQDASDLWTMRGDLHALFHDYTNAEFSYKQAIQHEKQFLIQAHLGLAEVLIRQNKYSEADIELKRILLKEVRNIKALTLSADLLWVQGQKNEAILHLKNNVLFYYPSNSAVKRKLSQFLLETQKYSEAHGILEELAAIFPEDWEIIVNLGQLYSYPEIANLEKALILLNKALSLAKSDKQITHSYFSLSQYYYKIGDFKEAEKNARNSLKINPANIFSGLVLAKCLLKQNREKDLTTQLEQFIKNGPDYQRLIELDAELREVLKKIPQN